MNAYQQMYLTLFKAMNEAIAILERAQQAAEEMYLEQEESQQETHT